MLEAVSNRYTKSLVASFIEKEERYRNPAFKQEVFKESQEAGIRSRKILASGLNPVHYCAHLSRCLAATGRCRKQDQFLILHQVSLGKPTWIMFPAVLCASSKLLQLEGLTPVMSWPYLCATNEGSSARPHRSSAPSPSLLSVIVADNVILIQWLIIIKNIRIIKVLSLTSRAITLPSDIPL